MRTRRAAKKRCSLSEREMGDSMKHGSKKNRRFMRRLKMRQAERNQIAAGRKAMRRKSARREKTLRNRIRFLLLYLIYRSI